MAAVLTRSAKFGAFSRLNNSHYVLMLGWAGADDKLVKKYADLYENRGLDTVRFTSEIKAFSTKGLQGMRDMDEIFPLLDQVQNRRLLIHIFSMNGIYSLTTLLHHAKYSDLFTKTDGVIWDSCPVDSMKTYLGGYDEIKKKKLESGFFDRLGFLAGKATFLSLAVMDSVTKWMHVSIGGSISDVNPYFYLRDHSHLPKRHTFFYSAADALCDATRIRSFHEHLSENRKMDVDANCFSDSFHVKHYPIHPVEYNEAIDRMLTCVARMYHPISKM